MEEDGKEGGRRLYRSKKEMMEDKRKKNVENWCEKRGEVKVSAPLIIDPTEDGKLIERIKKVVKQYNSQEGVEIKVVERGGSRMSSNVKSNPLGIFGQV